MGTIEPFDYSTIESLPDFDHLVTMETILSSADYMCDTTEAVGLNEWMSSGGGGVTAEDLQAMDDQLQYDQWWKGDEEFISFSRCSVLEASHKESLPWPPDHHDHPVVIQKKSNLPNLSQGAYLFSHGSNHHSSGGLKFRKSTRSGKNLIFERKRRTKVNQSLYNLRSVVPFITKMDKASIVKDTMTYIRHLQNRLKEIEDEIVALQLSQKESWTDMNALQINEDHVNFQTAKAHPIPLARSKHAAQTVIQVDACKIEGRTFRMTIYLLKQPRLLVQITKALESIETVLEVKSSNILSFHDHFVNTVIAKCLQTKDGTEIMEADGLEKMILHAAFEYGFSEEL